ncbi:hypothetical protein ACEQUB_p00374 (plasmid) [Ralstonia syzygii]|nr:hypothetical protein LMG10661_03673 [Ralstonia syzygii subsp. syzygii]
MLDADRIGLLLKQVDHRRAMQAQVVGLQALEQAGSVRVAAHILQDQVQHQAVVQSGTELASDL